MIPTGELMYVKAIGRYNLRPNQNFISFILSSEINTDFRAQNSKTFTPERSYINVLVISYFLHN